MYKQPVGTIDFAEGCAVQIVAKKSRQGFELGKNRTYHNVLHAVRYAIRILQCGCIPLGMLIAYEKRFSTKLPFLTECTINVKNDILNRT